MNDNDESIVHTETNTNTRMETLADLMKHQEETEDFRENIVLNAAEHVKSTGAQK